MSIALTISVEYGAEKVVDANQLRVEAGDNYVQLVGNGLNPTKDTWQVTIPHSSSADITAIENTLKSAVGQLLTWTAPESGATEKTYECPKTWKRKYHSFNNETLSFELKEAF